MLTIFDRMTEDARRVFLFARNEAARLGGKSITPEHLLLGLLQTDPTRVQGLLAAADSVQSIREELEERCAWGEKVPRSLDIPITDAARRVLTQTAREANRLWEHDIDTLHFLLGLICEEDSLASRILRDHGLEVSAVRTKLFHAAVDSVTSDGVRRRGGPPLETSQPIVPDEETAVRIAEAVFAPVFGRETVENQRPFQAELGNVSRGVDPWPAEMHDWSQVPPPGLYWIVRGTVSGTGGEPLTVMIDQGTARVFFFRFGGPSH